VCVCGGGGCSFIYRKPCAPCTKLFFLNPCLALYRCGVLGCVGGGGGVYIYLQKTVCAMRLDFVHSSKVCPLYIGFHLSRTAFPTVVFQLIFSSLCQCHVTFYLPLSILLYFLFSEIVQTSSWGPPSLFLSR